MMLRAVLLILLAATAVARAGDMGRATRDPFALPAVAVAPLPAPQRATATVAPATPVPAERAWRPPLHALMAAGPRSMANVGGVLLGLGDSVDGWRLMRVTESEAEFMKRGRRAVLRLERDKELQKP